MRQLCVYEDLFLPSQRCLTPPSWGTPCDINSIYTVFRKKHPLTYSFISPWRMCGFKQ